MNNNVTLSGWIKQIYSPETFSLNGEKVVYTNVRLQYKEDNASNYAVVCFWGDKQDILRDMKEGDLVDLEVWVHSKESHKNRGAFYHKLDVNALIKKY